MWGRQAEARGRMVTGQFLHAPEAGTNVVGKDLVKKSGIEMSNW